MLCTYSLQCVGVGLRPCACVHFPSSRRRPAVTTREETRVWLRYFLVSCGLTLPMMLVMWLAPSKVLEGLHAPWQCGGKDVSCVSAWIGRRPGYASPPDVPKTRHSALHR